MNLINLIINITIIIGKKAGNNNNINTILETITQTERFDPDKRRTIYHTRNTNLFVSGVDPPQ